MGIDPRDDEALTEYVLSFYYCFCTQTEMEILRALNLNTKKLNSSSPVVKAKLGDILEAIELPEIREAIAMGRSQSRLSIRDRLLRDHRNEMDLVLCPECHRLARTPLARMCIHCGFDWH